MSEKPLSRLQPVRGTHDLFGDDARGFWHVVDTFKALSRRYGFQPVDVPIFEFTELFARGIGETTDVVAKEMYSFEDRGGESLTLRPEFTAGLCRAYLSNGWQQFAPLKLAAHGPAFRYERPQKGRFRQFHQIDAEIIGVEGPQADVELIALAQHLLAALGLGDKVELRINTLGDPASRVAYRAALVAHFTRHKAALSEDSLMRLERNPLRILDSKEPGDKAVVAEAPVLDPYLSAQAAAFFAGLTAGLDAAGVAYVRDPRLVRGLDYYTHTAFEFVTTHLGAQGTVIGGGRYDGLIAELGGPPTPAVGWAGGIERLALLATVPAAQGIAVAVVPMGEAAESAALGLTAMLRRAGFSVDQAFRGAMKKRMARASALGCRVAVIVGEDELKSGQVAVKDLGTGEQRLVPQDALVDALAQYRD